MFDELSDARNEEIAASTPQHEKESFEEQETKLSNDCNTNRNIVERIPGEPEHGRWVNETRGA